MAIKFKKLSTDIIDNVGRARIDALKAALPPATVQRAGQAESSRRSSANDNRGEGEGFYLRMPEETVLALKQMALTEKTTARVLVLKALKKAGLPVPAEAITDRRRRA